MLKYVAAKLPLSRTTTSSRTSLSQLPPNRVPQHGGQVAVEMTYRSRRRKRMKRRRWRKSRRASLSRSARRMPMIPTTTMTSPALSLSNEAPQCLARWKTVPFARSVLLSPHIQSPALMVVCYVLPVDGKWPKNNNKISQRRSHGSRLPQVGSADDELSKAESLMVMLAPKAW